MARALIKIANDYAFLKTDTEEIKAILWKLLRFRPRNYWHSRLYKQGKWDGYTNFFSQSSGRFLSGLLPEVLATLRHLKVEYKIEDLRTKISLLYEKIDANFFNQYKKQGRNIVLDDYQVDYVNRALSYQRGIILAPTASGKTLVMMAILKCLKPNVPALILCNKKSLAQQNYEEMLELGFTNAGIMHSDCHKPNVVTCACWQSLHLMEKLLPYIKVVIVDEIHEMMSDGPKACYRKLKNCGMRIAVSATPFKFGGKDKPQKYGVKGFFGPVFKTESHAAEDGILKTSKLQECGRLSKAKCVFYPITEPDLTYEIYQDAVEKGISQNLYFNNIVERLAHSLQGRTLILVERLPHGDLLKGLIPEALWIQGKDNLNTRKEVITQLRSSTTNTIAIATIGIFNTGLSVHLHNLINAAGGQAEHVIIQRFGRGLRVADDKELLHYYDFIFEINEYLYTHSQRRIRILEHEGHNIEIKKSLDF